MGWLIHAAVGSGGGGRRWNRSGFAAYASTRPSQLNRGPATPADALRARSDLRCGTAARALAGISDSERHCSQRDPSHSELAFCRQESEPDAREDDADRVGQPFQHGFQSRQSPAPGCPHMT